MIHFIRTQDISDVSFYTKKESKIQVTGIRCATKRSKKHIKQKTLLYKIQKNSFGILSSVNENSYNRSIRKIQSFYRIEIVTLLYSVGLELLNMWYMHYNSFII